MYLGYSSLIIPTKDPIVIVTNPNINPIVMNVYLCNLIYYHILNFN